MRRDSLGLALSKARREIDRLEGRIALLEGTVSALKADNDRLIAMVRGEAVPSLSECYRGEK